MPTLAVEKIDLEHLAEVCGGADAPDTTGTPPPSTGGLPTGRSDQATNASSDAAKSYALACARGMSWGGPPGIGCAGNMVWNAIQRNK